MKESDRIKSKQAKRREDLAKLLKIEELTDEQREEMERLTEEYEAGLKELRAAEIAETEAVAAIDDAGETPEQRERNQLRDRASFGRYLLAAVSGRQIDGAEAEFRAACGLADGIPLDLFQWPAERRQAEQRADAPTPAPQNVAQNLAMIAPAVFAASIIPSLRVEMPIVPSGTYGQPRIATSLTAGPEGKGDARESTAATIDIGGTAPHRITGRLSLRVEDLYGSGLEDMEASLRQNLTLAMSAALDAQGLAGDGTGNNVTGLLKRIDAATPATAVVSYESAVETLAGLVDGIWARSKMDLGLTVNTSAYGKFNALWRGENADVSLADNLARMLGSFGVHSRMPANDAQNKRADALVVRRGQSGIRLAVMPIWNRALMIDDQYTDSAAGIRHLTIHSIVGDVLLAQPDAYKRVSFKTA